MPAWGGNHAEQAIRLQRAVRCLASNKKMNDRLEAAFNHLLGLLPHISMVPRRQREKLEFIFSMRASVNLTSSAGAQRFIFNNLSRKDRKTLTDAILSLYEACLIDLGRLNDGQTEAIYDPPEAL